MSMLTVISVAADKTIIWNGDNISEAALKSHLEDSKTIAPTPVTQIKFAPNVDCDTVARLRQLISTTLDCRYRTCAEGRGRWWEIGDVGPPFVVYDPHPNLPQDQEADRR